jgi:YHS domain-containing protein
MAVDAASAPKSAYTGATFYFCSRDHEGLFDKTPEGFMALIGKAQMSRHERAPASTDGADRHGRSF